MQMQHKREYPVDKGGECMHSLAMYVHSRREALDVQHNFGVAVRLDLKK